MKNKKAERIVIIKAHKEILCHSFLSHKQFKKTAKSLMFPVKLDRYFLILLLLLVNNNIFFFHVLSCIYCALFSLNRKLSIVKNIIKLKNR